MTIPIKIISKKEFLRKYKKPNQEKIWDNIAKPWKKYVVKKIPGVEKFLKNKKGKVIDLGCGSGRNMITNKNIKYTGIDFSLKQLEKAKEYLKDNQMKAKLIKSEVSNLKEIKDNTFDYGLFIAALHCIETPEKRKKSLEELYRVLKPKAKALITVWDSEDKRFSHIKNKGDIYMAWREDNIPHMRYYYLYKKQELKELIKSSRFKIISFHQRKEEDKVRFNKKNWILQVEK